MEKYVLTAVVILAVAIAFLIAPKVRATESERITALSEDERAEWFWQIIERTRSTDQEKQLAALRGELSKLPPAEIELFGAELDRQLAATYSWDLWGAAYVIMGGASDDSFEYFRVWMISQGRSFFEAARADPDALAKLIPDNFDDIPDFELLAYVAGEVWAQKTGREATEMPNYPNMMYMTEPAGTPFGESDEEIAKRYPHLWERFSEAPLG